MRVRAVCHAAVLVAMISVVSAAAAAQTTGNAATTGENATGEWKSGRTYLVTDAEKTVRFGGKDVILPQGAEFQFQDGFFVVTLSPSSKKDAAVVRVGSSYLVITKREKLVIDPNGVARNPKFAFRVPPRRTPYRPAVNEVPNASPFEP